VTGPAPFVHRSIHVCGGDLLATPRSEWDPETSEERPYDVAAAFRYFEEQNAKLSLGLADRVGEGPRPTGNPQLDAAILSSHELPAPRTHNDGSGRTRRRPGVSPNVHA
jgi:hypothetical protein